MPCNRPKYRNFWRQVARTDEPADPFRDRIFRCLINLDCQIVWTILQTRSPINIVDKNASRMNLPTTPLPVAGTTKDTTKKYRFNSRCEAFLARAKHVVAAESSSGWLVEKAINGAIRMKSVPA